MPGVSSPPVLKNKTAQTALKTLKGLGNFVVAMIFVAGTLGGIVVAAAQFHSIPINNQPVMVIAITSSSAILIGAFLAAMGSGALIYAFVAINSATRKAKADLEMLVMQGMIKIRSSRQENTIVWKALDADAPDTAPGVEIQRAGDVGAFFPRHILEKMAQLSSNH